MFTEKLRCINSDQWEQKKISSKNKYKTLIERKQVDKENFNTIFGNKILYNETFINILFVVGQLF